MTRTYSGYRAASSRYPAPMAANTASTRARSPSRERTAIRKLYGSKNARAISILYGGSMNERNAFELLAQPDIDGGLIGGASLVPEKFVKIIEAANQPTL